MAHSLSNITEKKKKILKMQKDLIVCVDVRARVMVIGG